MSEVPGNNGADLAAVRLEVRVPPVRGADLAAGSRSAVGDPAPVAGTKRGAEEAEAEVELVKVARDVPAQDPPVQVVTCRASLKIPRKFTLIGMDQRILELRNELADVIEAIKMDFNERIDEVAKAVTVQEPTVRAVGKLQERVSLITTELMDVEDRMAKLEDKWEARPTEVKDNDLQIEELQNTLAEIMGAPLEELRTPPKSELSQRPVPKPPAKTSVVVPYSKAVHGVNGLKAKK